MKLKHRRIIALLSAFFLGVIMSQIVVNLFGMKFTTKENIPPKDYEQMQQNFDQEFQRSIDMLDRNWQMYHTVLENFKEGSADLPTTAERLQNVSDEQDKIIEQIQRIKAPDENTLARLDKMIRYSAEQFKTIDQSRISAENLLNEDSENPIENPTDELLSARHDYQSKVLQDVMIRNSPVSLFVFDK